jgi:hypothetical protein
VSAPETVVRVQVKLGKRLYTYGVRCPAGAEPEPGDWVIIPAPPWLPDFGPQIVPVEHVGSGCAETGYAGPLTMARLAVP